MSSDFTMYAGDTKVITVLVEDEAGAPVPLDDATITWKMSKSVLGGFSPTATVTKTTDDGITKAESDDGVFSVTLDPEDTQGLSGHYYQEAQVVTGGNTYTALTGYVSILPTLVD